MVDAPLDRRHSSSGLFNVPQMGFDPVELRQLSSGM
jgi:hypothetical protein